MTGEVSIKECRAMLTDLLEIWADTLDDPPDTTIYIHLIWGLSGLSAFAARRQCSSDLPRQITAVLQDAILAKFPSPEGGSTVSIRLTKRAVSAHQRLLASERLATLMPRRPQER